MADPAPNPTVIPPIAAERMRSLLDDLDRGERARSEILKGLDPRGIYSREADPKPVFIVYKGELREIEPISLFNLSSAAPPPAPGR